MKRCWMLWLFVCVLVACGSRTPPDRYVIIAVDGHEIRHPTQAATVGDVLDEAGIVRGPLDRVSPDLNESIERINRITITRVHEQLEIESRTVPFTRILLRDEAVADGVARVAQLGVNGHEEL